MAILHRLLFVSAREKRSILLFCSISLILAACQPARTPVPTADDPYPAAGKYFGPVATDAEKTLLTPMPPADAPEPEAGMAGLSGALYSYTINKIIPETMFYLTKAEGDNRDTMPAFLAGPDPARGDLVEQSDPYGNFQLNDIPPGSYFLVVSAPYNWCPAETSPDDPAPRLIRLAAGDRLALGIVYVSWP
jgi:hypothetical protein